MHCIQLFSYDQARNLCSGSRFAKKGRRLCNYAKIWFIPAQGGDTERLEIRRSYGAKVPLALLYPTNTVHIPNVTRLTANELSHWFGLFIGRDKKKYQFVEDRFGNAFLTSHEVIGSFPTSVEMRRPGVLLREGVKVPTVIKNDDASLRWRRRKREFDTLFKTCCKLQVFSDLMSGERQRTQETWATHPQTFVQAVMDQDTRKMAELIAAMHLPSYRSYADTEKFSSAMLTVYEQHYEKFRLRILVASGARVET